MLLVALLLKLFTKPFTVPASVLLVLTHRVPSARGISRSDFCNNLNEFEKELAEHSVVVQCKSRNTMDCYPYQQICSCGDDGQNVTDSTNFMLSCRSYIVKFPQIYFYTETAHFELDSDSGAYKPDSFQVCECVTQDSEMQCLEANEELFYVLPSGFACSLFKEVRPCANMSAHMESMTFPTITQFASDAAVVRSPLASLFWMLAISALVAWTMSVLSS